MAYLKGIYIVIIALYSVVLFLVGIMMCFKTSLHDDFLEYFTTVILAIIGLYQYCSGSVFYNPLYNKIELFNKINEGTKRIISVITLILSFTLTIYFFYKSLNSKQYSDEALNIMLSGMMVNLNIFVWFIILLSYKAYIWINEGFNNK